MPDHAMVLLAASLGLSAGCGGDSSAAVDGSAAIDGPWADAPPRSRSCTAGVDCYCDLVRGGSLVDPDLLLCEDFEAPTLRNDQGLGEGAPYFGPWYDDTGQTGNRGVNSYWNRSYGNGVSSFLFEQGEPASPGLGATCSFPLCTGNKTWDAADRWSANQYQPLLAIFADTSDFTAELDSLAAPTNGTAGGAGVFDGSASLAYRVPAGATHGIAGEASFATTRELGYTAALAYPVNSLSSGIWGTDATNASWKHDEWSTVYNPNSGFDGLFSFYNQLGPRTGLPFSGFLGSFADQSYSACSSVVPAVGNAECMGSGLGIVWNTPEGYSQPTDWPFGTWGCVRGHLENAGLSNMRLRIWFQGPGMSDERLIIDFTADATQLDNRDGYRGMKWNAYANTNQGGGYVASTELTFRYQDNVHVRSGPPVPCSQIGF